MNQCEYAIKKKNGIRYAFIGAGHNLGLVSSTKYDDVKRIIKEVRPKADIIIVMFHGGGEGASYQRIHFKREFYAGEDRGNVVEFAHVCIDAGADLIIGSGPHVTRAVEIFISCKVLSTFQSKGSKNGPEIDPEHRALKYIKYLSNTDFPNSRLTFSASGEIKTNH